jgi:hypothetical protein
MCGWRVKLTNRLGLPQPIVDAVRNDGYSRGDSDISVTQLLAPPRQVALARQHSADIEEDVSERIWSLVGQVMHGILERANTTGIAERRLFMEVEGWKVSGGMDAYYEHGLLQDYKFITSWKFKGGKATIEHEQQLNCYAAILRANSNTVNKLQIVGILRDWSKMEAERDPEYPQTQVIVVPVPLWAPEKAYAFMRERVVLHQQARVALPQCSPEERWAKPDVYAVMKDGRKTAVRLYETKAEADNHAMRDNALTVVKRPGVSTRCRYYCSVAKFCRAKGFTAMADDEDAIA